jgi:hypothetical protein
LTNPASPRIRNHPARGRAGRGGRDGTGGAGGAGRAGWRRARGRAGGAGPRSDGRGNPPGGREGRAPRRAGTARPRTPTPLRAGERTPVRVRVRTWVHSYGPMCAALMAGAVLASARCCARRRVVRPKPRSDRLLAPRHSKLLAVRVGINMVDGEVCRGSEHAVVLAVSRDLVVCVWALRDGWRT